MRRLVPTIVIFSFVAIAVSAQDSCPILTVDGPAGIVNVGDIATYRASLDLKGSQVTPTFRWTVSVGEIVSGQGTNTIEVRQPNACITATVEVDGFPDSCPLVASETSCGDPAPEAVKIGEMSNTSPPDLEVVRRFRDELRANPNNQGFIFLAYPPDLPKAKLTARENAIRDLLTNERLMSDFDGSRITLVQATSKRDITEFWRVPPGASNPTCESCGPSNVCPKITVSGPAGYIAHGMPTVFSINADLPNLENLKYEWNVTAGMIDQGQGRPHLYLITNNADGGKELKVKVQVIGLPAGCSDTAEFVYGELQFEGDPVPLDEWGRIPVRLESERLDLVAASWKQNPSNYFYFIIYRRPGETTASEAAPIKRIRAHLITKKKVPADRVIFVSSGDLGIRSSTVVYMIPPGAAKPTP